jgi:tetratricopeptide (TPR) repeat protein
MRWLAIFLFGWSLTSTAWAQDSEVETFGDKGPPPISAEDVKPLPVTTSNEGPYVIDTVQDLATLPYEPVIYRGANQIHMPPEFVYDVREGLELIYKRDYQGARTYFREVEERFPHTGLTAVSDVLVWQALMLENFDFKYEKQYWVSSEQARTDLTAALAVEGGEAWEYFLMAGVAGIEAIHTMRRSHYLKALQLAFEAIGHVNMVRELAPNFVDLALADGMYNYWRTVVTLNSKLLPDFGDHRAEGIAQMRQVEQGGIFLAAPTTLAMVFTWQEESNMKEALSSCVKNYRRYPNNIINNLVMGSTYIYTRRMKLALETFDRISTTDPNNHRVKYWRGLALQRSGKYPESLASFQDYLGGEHLEDYQIAYSYYRIASTYRRMKEYAKADDYYRRAIKENGHKGAKSGLDSLRKLKKDGKISY